MLLRVLIFISIVLISLNSPFPKFDSTASVDKFNILNLTIIDEAISRYYMNHAGELPEKISDKEILPELQNMQTDKFSYSKLDDYSYILSFKDKSGQTHLSPNSNKTLPPHQDRKK